MDVYRGLREEALEANLEISRQKLAIYTWGNVSAFDPAKGVFAIKPSGVSYDKLTAESMVVVDLEGLVVDGKYKPSSDTETHRILYREFSGSDHTRGLRGITHTHSSHATVWAQSRRSVPVFGTTHADHGAAAVPCTSLLSEDAVKGEYERETGNLIIETFKKEDINPVYMPMILVAGHGPFTWGKSAAESVYNAAVLEEVCKMAFLTLSLNPNAEALPDYIVNKHWERKHGSGAYYGQ